MTTINYKDSFNAASSRSDRFVVPITIRMMMKSLKIRGEGLKTDSGPTLRIPPGISRLRRRGGGGESTSSVLSSNVTRSRQEALQDLTH